MYKCPLLSLMQANLTDDELLLDLEAAMTGDHDDLGYVKSVLDRIASKEEQKRLLRKIHRDGMSMFGSAASWSGRWNKRPLLQYWLDELLNTEEDNVYFLTTASLRMRTNPLRLLVDNLSIVDLFEAFILRLTPKQRIEQLIFKSYGGHTILTASKKEDFMIKLAEIMETALNAIDGLIDDFDTLWALFTFCFNNIKESKYLVCFCPFQ